MGMTLQDQLSQVPIPRLTTVLRVNFDLRQTGESFDQATSMVETWWNKKARPYEISIGPSTPSLSFSRNRFKIDFARSDEAFVLAMEEPDSTVEGRAWICELNINRNAGRPQFAVRISYRQPQNSPHKPEPRGPRFLREIVDAVGATDFWDLDSNYRIIDAENLPFFMELLRAPTRTLPVIVISEDDRTGDVVTSPENLARLLAGTAHVIRLKVASSWQISNEWGKDWSTFRGAVRCYNANFSRDGDFLRHRLWLPESIQRTDANIKNGFVNACAGHVFAQVTAQFETLPLQSPTVIRRLVEEAARPIKRPAVIHLAEPSSVKVATQRNAGVIDHPDVQAATPQSDKALAAIEAELVNSYRANEDLAARLSEQEENARALESALQQERAGRAELERKHLETQADLELFEKEVQSLEQQKQLALGDVSIEQSAALKPLWQDFNGLFNSLQNVASQFRRFEQDSLRLEELERDLGVANQTVINLKATIESLNRRQSSSDGAGPSTSSVDRDDLMNLLPEMVQKNPPLKCSLGVIAAIFPDRVAVLDSALASAARSDEFKYGGQAFELLWTLGTSYWETIQSGKGDSEARKHFGINAFSTQESVKLTKSGRNSRTFEYRGRPIVMEKHLKIGSAENAADTLRIHFEWVAEDKLIVVGYCGAHLNF